MRRRIPEEEKIRRIVRRRRASAERNAKRRAQAYGAKVVVDITYDEIRQRDGDDCYLCGKFVSVHDMTFDHVMPLSEGGDHAPDNVRIAHRVCNSQKGARLL
jgi:5-methylcytosine-specific restriction endonuclease McrA